MWFVQFGKCKSFKIPQKSLGIICINSQLAVTQICFCMECANISCICYKSLMWLCKYLYCWFQNIPTVRPAANFDPEADSKALREAMRGFGCNNEEILAILPHRSANQRANIEQVYKTMFGRDLIEDLQSELGGNFERLVIAMMHPWPQFGARAIKKACKGVGTNEQTLVDVLCTANNCEIRMITDAYKQSEFP